MGRRGCAITTLSRRAVLVGGAASLLSRPTLAQSQGLLERLMREHRVPAASVVIIRKGTVAEQLAVGCDSETLFQAASISKVVTGQIVLRLVERGRIDLDRPVNEVLRSWTLPGPFAASVTPRLLLCHRGGTTVPGFPGYATGARLPGLKQILDGTPPANTPAVRAEFRVGGAFRYSGGGTMVLQQLIEDVAGRPFDELARELVLAPTDMRRSRFEQPLTANETNAASAHDADGKELPGRCQVYPELAAAALWSTPADLARLALAMAASWRGEGGLIGKALSREAATPVGGGPTGLGIFATMRKGEAPVLYHEGVNAGFRSLFAITADAESGGIFMTNGEGGSALIAAYTDTNSPDRSR
jgi:CubicO group peptidase (beta-lactamase class C family)